MSNSATGGLPSSYPLLGGIAIKDQDFAAAIIFAIAYVALLPVVAWRLGAKSSRVVSAMWRPALFVVVRIATFGIRAAEADMSTFNESLFIAELVMLSVGTVFLVSPLVSLLTYHYSLSERGTLPKKSKKNTVFRLLQVALIVVIALGIYVGSSTSSAISNPDSAGDLTTIRNAAAVLTVAVIAIIIVATLYIHLTMRQSAVPPAMSRTAFIVVSGALLLINTIYKLLVYKNKPDPFHSGTKVAFYICFVVTELLAAILFFAVNIKTLFRVDEAQALQKEEWSEKAPLPDMEMGNQYAYGYRSEQAAQYPPRL